MNKGDFLEIDYVGRVKATNEIFDLTSEEVAKKEKVYDPKQKYGPSLVVLGSGMAIPGVEKQLENMKIGDEKEFEIRPEEGFGTRNPKLVKIISITKFFKEKINPVPGAYVNIDGIDAKIQSVSGGRVRIDFNNPLAGKELKYKLKIVRKIETSEEKIISLLNHYNLKSAETKIENNELVVKLEKDLNPVIKTLLEKMITKWIEEIKSVKFEVKGK
jgi:FKBP-type peptidyl-prolyl cis-trans isomerase 2